MSRVTPVNALDIDNDVLDTQFQVSSAGLSKSAKSGLTRLAAWINDHNVPFLVTSIGMIVMLLWAGSYKMTAPGAEGTGLRAEAVPPNFILGVWHIECLVVNMECRTISEKAYVDEIVRTSYDTHHKTSNVASQQWRTMPQLRPTVSIRREHRKEP